MFPGYHVRAITNGVHAPTWAHAGFTQLFQTVIPHWALEPEMLDTPTSSLMMPSGKRMKMPKASCWPT